MHQNNYFKKNRFIGLFCIFLCLISSVVDPTLVTIVSGSNDGVTGTTHPVQQIVTHPIYQHEVLDYNIALVKISDSFKWNKKTRPIKLPNKEIAANTQTMVAGYGWTKPVSNHMQLLPLSRNTHILFNYLK